MKGFWWFVVGLAFFLTVLIFTIVIMSGEPVAESAMNNVSFASSIVSIVLAVISIFISMAASQQTDRNLASMQELDRKMNESIARLESIKADTQNTKETVEKFVKANPIDISVKENREQKGNEPIFRYSPKTQQNNRVRLNINELVKLALAKVSKIFDLDIKPYYKLNGATNLIFDGYAEKDGELYVFEVKAARTARSAVTIFRHYLENLSNVLQQANLFPNVIMVVVCPDNNKETIQKALNDKLFVPGLNFSVLVFDLNDLEDNEESE